MIEDISNTPRAYTIVGPRNKVLYTGTTSGSAGSYYFDTDDASGLWDSGQLTQIPKGMGWELVLGPQPK